MEIIKKYLKNIGWILIASILLGVTGELAEDIFWTNHEAIAITRNNRFNKRKCENRII